MLRDQQLLDEVDIILPTGELVRFRLHGQELCSESARCYVVKDAGDDPDVTNGAEIHAELTLTKASGEETVIITGGTGIGRVTKPGLAIPPGEWAINPIPRKMIAQVINEVFSIHCPLLTSQGSPLVPQVTISIPNGEELARKTLNSRLGIIGGLSILGTTGIVKPISSRAWTETINAAVDVAVACGSKTLVLSTGRTSELAVQKHFAAVARVADHPCRTDRVKLPGKIRRTLSDEAFIMMGDHVGHALRACESKGIRNVILAAQFAKLLKIACGHEQTHVSSSRLDLKQLEKWLAGSPRAMRFVPCVRQANTARDVLEATGAAKELISLVGNRASHFAAQLAPCLRIKVLLAGYAGEVLYFR